MRRALKKARKVTFYSITFSLGLLFITSIASAGTCIFNPNEQGAYIDQNEGYTNSLLQIQDSDCTAGTWSPDWTTQAGVHAMLGHILAAKAMNRELEVEYDDYWMIIESIRIIEP